MTPNKHWLSGNGMYRIRDPSQYSATGTAPSSGMVSTISAVISDDSHDTIASTTISTARNLN